MSAKDPVLIVAYDPDWPRSFEIEKARLAQTVGFDAENIRHVGSTAVPGLCAKPVLDLLVGVDSPDSLDRWVAPVVAAGYRYRPEFETEFPNRRLFQKVDEEERSLIHLHLVPIGDEFWERHLLFRDYLRVHPKAAEEYARFKEELAERFREDRNAYTEAKTPFIRAAEEEARGWKRSQESG